MKSADAALFDALRAVAAETFHCKPEEIVEATVADDIPGWDSLSYTVFIMRLEETFDVEFDVAELSRFARVGDLFSTLVEKKRNR